MAKKRKTTATVRHPFLYRLSFTDKSPPLIKKAMARVHYSTRPVTITLTAEHVRKSMKLGGAGRSDICAGAICTIAHAQSFPHPVVGGMDFHATRVFIPSKRNAFGLPSDCFVYEHNATKVAELNDTRGGQAKLLEMIERDGPISIELKPHRVRSIVGRPGKGRGKSGKRAKSLGRGARLRWARMQLGGPPA